MDGRPCSNTGNVGDPSNWDPRIMKDYVDPKTVIDGAGLEEDGIRSYWIPKADESYYRELMKIW